MSKGRSSPSGPLVAERLTFTADFASVGAAAVSRQTAPVPGLKTSDMVVVAPPATLTAGLAIASCRVSAADTIEVTFVNPTGGAIDPPSLTYQVTRIVTN